MTRRSVSKADWISLATVPLGAGIAWFVVGQKTAIACLAIGVLLVLSIHFWPKKKKPVVEKEKPPEARASLTSYITQTASPTINVNVNHPQPTPPDPAPSLPPPAKYEPNIVCLGARAVVLAHSTHEGRSFYEARGGASSFDGIAVCFRNEAVYGRRVKSVQFAKAQLRFMNSAGTEVGEVPSACWLDETSMGVELSPSEGTKCVLVLISNDEMVLVPWKRTQRTQWGDRLAEEDLKLDGFPAFAEVRILDNNTNSLLMPPVHLEISVKDRKPKATIK